MYLKSQIKDMLRSRRPDTTYIDGGASLCPLQPAINPDDLKNVARPLFLQANHARFARALGPSAYAASSAGHRIAFDSMAANQLLDLPMTIPHTTGFESCSGPTTLQKAQAMSF